LIELARGGRWTGRRAIQPLCPAPDSADHWSRKAFVAPFEWFIWQVPALRNDAIRHIFVEAHEYGANALLALIGLHAGPALSYRLILRDGVLHRMLPWGVAASWIA